MIRSTIAILFSLIMCSVYASESFELNVQISSTKDSGKSWDFNSGMPDIFITVDGIDRVKCKDRFYCQTIFNSEIDSQRFSIEIADKDLKSDDFIGSGSCSIGEQCVIGDATIHINRYEPEHDFGNCDPEIVRFYSERELITHLSQHGSIKDYGYEIAQCELSEKANSMLIKATNWYVGANLLNLYRFNSTLSVRKDGLDPRYLATNPDKVLTTTEHLIDLKEALTSRPVFINNNRLKK